jgi:hypothetical protein
MMPQIHTAIARQRKRATLACALAVAVAALAASAHAQRFVMVNGQLMNMAQIADIEQLNCGPIADGSYWFNEANGAWGYAGNPYPQGILGANCQQARRPSLSERRMLFSPLDWVR